MKRLAAVLIVLFAAAVPAFAHAGHIHTHMGTVTMIHSDHEFMMKMTDGKDMTVETSAKTVWRRADGHAAKSSDLAVGNRVVVKIGVDGKTAMSVKMAPPKK